MQTGTSLIRLEGVRKIFFSPGSGGSLEVLKGVDLEVAQGESVAIVGPSGCGKSTLLNLIGGLDSPDDGSVFIENTNINSFSGEKLARFRNETVGFLFQNHHLLPQCSVMENVLIPCLAFHASPTSEMESRAKDLLQRIGLEDRMHHRPSQLSGGERQRVAFVRSLILNPKFILADEPTGSLDPETAKKMADLLLEMNQSEGLTLIVVTHSMELASRMGRTCRFANGLLVEDSSQPVQA